MKFKKGKTSLVMIISGMLVVLLAVLFMVVLFKSMFSSEKYGVVIPSGFTYVEGTKDTGLVIEDSEGNQFVWIPVEDYSKFIRGSAEIIEGESEVYKMTGTLASDYIEPHEDIYGVEQAEYEAMCASVEKYKGFYIARFEAGDGEASEARTGATSAHKVVSKKGAFVYNYVPWGESMVNVDPFRMYDYDIDDVAGAVYLSRNMYKDSDSVVSTLCYGVQWDAIMNFISDEEHNIDNSASWGNYEDSIGEAAVNSGTLQKCGSNESWKAKNIYDLAGNVWEWTMEAHSLDYRFERGGYYRNGGSSYSASARALAEPNLVYSSSGFRPALYIK